MVIGESPRKAPAAGARRRDRFDSGGWQRSAVGEERVLEEA
jgi:hypothetical protein